MKRAGVIPRELRCLGDLPWTKIDILHSCGVFKSAKIPKITRVIFPQETYHGNYRPALEKIGVPNSTSRNMDWVEQVKTSRTSDACAKVKLRHVRLARRDRLEFTLRNLQVVGAAIAFYVP